MQISRPTPVRVSLWLFVVSLVAGPLMAIWSSSEQRSTAEGSAGYLVMLLLIGGVPYYAVRIFFAAMAYRRRNWGRWVHAGLLVASILMSIGAQQLVSGATPLERIANLIICAVEVTCVALLFTRVSSSWYSMKDQDSSDDSLQRP